MRNAFGALYLRALTAAQRMQSSVIAKAVIEYRAGPAD
jgi:hypothetical protein